MERHYSSIHSVQFYDTHLSLIERLAGIVSSGLLLGNSAVVVAGDEHRTQLIEAFKRMDFDVRAYARSGQFSMYDAREMLDTFMAEGRPIPERFERSIRQVLVDTKSASKHEPASVTAFGEMVALLWQDGNKAGALEVERLWNNILREGAIHLHCAYPRDLVSLDPQGMQNICECHSHILETLGPAA